MFMASFQSILRQLGPRYLIYRMPGRYGSFPLADVFPISNAVVFSEVRDPEEFVQALAKFSLFPAPVGPQVSTVLGKQVISVNVMYFTIYFAMLEKETLITMNPQLLKTRSRRSGGRDHRSWRRQHSRKPGGLSPPRRASFSTCRRAASRAASTTTTSRCCSRPCPWLERSRAACPVQPRLRATRHGPILFPRGSDIARHAKQATFLTAVDDGQGVLFDGTAPILTTPYYWAYVHALTRLKPLDSQYPAFMLALTPFIPPSGD